MGNLKINKVLVILASYNGSLWIVDQINSIINQSNISVYIYISDDFSTDSTFELVEKYYESNMRVIIKRNKVNSGSAGLNFITTFRDIDVSSYDYIAYCDQDDIWYPEKLSTAINSLHISCADGYSSAVLAFWPDMSEIILSQSVNIRRADFLFEGAGQGCTFVLPVARFRRLQDFCLTNYQLISEFHFHDWLTYLLFRTWGYRWFFDQRVSMKYRQHLANDIGARKSISSIMKRVALIRNGWYKKQLTLALIVYKLAGGNDYKIIKFTEDFKASHSILRKISLSFFIFFYGRRRMMDRVMLVAAIFFSWI